MPGIPRLDKNASMLAAALGAVVVIVVTIMGSPISTVGYLLLAVGLGALAWAALSRISAAYS